MTKTLLAVDGNSLVHRSFHAMASSNLHTRDGRPTWAVKGFCSQMLGAIDRVGADAVIVGFDDHTSSERKAQWPHYKATRKPKPPELGQQLALTAQLLRDAGIHVVVPAGLEADDVLASASHIAGSAGWHTIVLTSDRDSFALIREHTSVLRLLNGADGGIDGSPILTPDRLETLTGVRPEQYREYAAMRGDTSDNLVGMVGIGEKTASKLLAEFGTVAAALADVDEGGERTAAALGKACVTKLAKPENREAFERNVAIMTMRHDLPLDGFDPAAGSGCLPLDPDRVTAALDAVELTSVRRPALATLCGIGRQAAPVPVEPDWPDQMPLREPDDLYDPGYPPAEPAAWAAPTAPASEPSWAPAPEPVPTAASLLATAPVAAMAGSRAPRPTNWDDTLF